MQTTDAVYTPDPDDGKPAVIDFHPIADIFPLLEGALFDALAADINENGLHDAITLHPDGSILDGRNRYRACLMAGVEPRFETWRGEGDIIKFVVSKNLHRRQLNETQRAQVADRLAMLEHGANQWSCKSATPPTQDQAADMLNVSKRMVSKARIVREKGVPELNAAVARGEVKMNTAEKVARMPVEKQKAAVAGGDKAMRELAKQPPRRDDASPNTEMKAAYGLTDAELEHCFALTDGVSDEMFEAALAEASAENDLSRNNLISKLQTMKAATRTLGLLKEFMEFAESANVALSVEALTPAEIKRLLPQAKASHTWLAELIAALERAT